MKYYLLKALVKLMSEKVKNIKRIKRIDNNVISVEFNDKDFYYFDLTKGNSTVFKTNTILKEKKFFNAPFDVILQKRFVANKIKKIELYNNDKVINITVSSNSSYKKMTTILQLEFTGKHTNIIILDENRVILEALRHIDEKSSSRVVQVGLKLDEIPKGNFIPKEEKVDDIESFLYEIYNKKQEQFLENTKKQKVLQLNKKIKKIQNLIKSLPKKEELIKYSNDLYEKANLILANLHKIKPYQNFLEIKNYSGQEVKIDLGKTPNVNFYVNEVFEKAKKAKQKSQHISIEVNNLNQKLNYLLRMVKNIQNALSIYECEFLYPKKEKNQARIKKAKQCESFFFEKYKIMLGTSQKENIYLLENSRASDFWFHLKDRPSAHVIVQNTKKTLPEEVIKKAAEICAKFSLDFTGNIEVDYTQRRNVKIQSGANVLYNPYKTIVVKI